MINEEPRVNIVCPTEDELRNYEKKSMKCSVGQCGKIFTNPSSMRMHLACAHNYGDKETIENFSKFSCTPKVKKKFACPVSTCCRRLGSGKYFRDLTPLRLHYMSQHAEKKFSCSKCTAKFGSQDMLNQHMKSCSQIFSCSCGTPFKKKSSLAYHAVKMQHELPEDIKQEFFSRRRRRWKRDLCQSRNGPFKLVIGNQLESYLKSATTQITTNAGVTRPLLITPQHQSIQVNGYLVILAENRLNQNVMKTTDSLQGKAGSASQVESNKDLGMSANMNFTIDGSAMPANADALKSDDPVILRAQTVGPTTTANSVSTSAKPATSVIIEDSVKRERLDKAMQKYIPILKRNPGDEVHTRYTIQKRVRKYETAKNPKKSKKVHSDPDSVISIQNCLQQATQFVSKTLPDIKSPERPVLSDFDANDVIEEGITETAENFDAVAEKLTCEEGPINVEKTCLPSSKRKIKARSRSKSTSFAKYETSSGVPSERVSELTTKAGFNVTTNKVSEAPRKIFSEITTITSSDIPTNSDSLVAMLSEVSKANDTNHRTYQNTGNTGKAQNKARRNSSKTIQKSKRYSDSTASSSFEIIGRKSFRETRSLGDLKKTNSEMNQKSKRIQKNAAASNFQINGKRACRGTQSVSDVKLNNEFDIDGLSAELIDYLRGGAGSPKIQLVDKGSLTTCERSSQETQTPLKTALFQLDDQITFDNSDTQTQTDGFSNLLSDAFTQTQQHHKGHQQTQISTGLSPIISDLQTTHGDASLGGYIDSTWLMSNNETQTDDFNDILSDAFTQTSRQQTTVSTGLSPIIADLKSMQDGDHAGNYNSLSWLTNNNETQTDDLGDILSDAFTQTYQPAKDDGHKQSTGLSPIITDLEAISSPNTQTQSWLTNNNETQTDSLQDILSDAFTQTRLSVVDNQASQSLTDQASQSCTTDNNISDTHTQTTLSFDSLIKNLNLDYQASLDASLMPDFTDMCTQTNLEPPIKDFLGISSAECQTAISAIADAGSSCHAQTQLTFDDLFEGSFSEYDFGAPREINNICTQTILDSDLFIADNVNQTS